MGLLFIPVPLFDNHMSVRAYLFRYHIYCEDENERQSTPSPLMDALNKGGVRAFTGNKPLFFPIRSHMLLDDLDRQCRQPRQKIVFLSEDPVPCDDVHFSSLAYLRAIQYQFALTHHPYYDKDSDALLDVCDYIFLPAAGETPRAGRKPLIRFYKNKNRHLSLVAVGMQSHADYEEAIRDGADLVEGDFYRLPVTRGENKITPLKANLIHLLNIVRDENFEFSTVAEIVQRDPALSLSLMRFVNSPFIGVRHKIRTIHHAVTILGQQEVRKWVTAAVFRSLATDSPGELARLSLVRAKFAENLAGAFHLSKDSQSLFLMGLFSLLDAILETTMPAALEMISLSDEIYEALVEGRGKFFPLLYLVRCYERADWEAIIRQVLLFGVTADDICDAYIDAVSWYNSLISEQVRPVR